MQDARRGRGKLALTLSFVQNITFTSYKESVSLKWESVSKTVKPLVNQRF
jgi:hypothetical protein